MSLSIWGKEGYFPKTCGQDFFIIFIYNIDRVTHRGRAP